MTTQVGPDMVIDKVDDNDRVIGTVRRAEVFRQRVNFRVVHVFVFNSKSELLLQELHQSRERHPSRWGSSVAGYVFSGESYEEAAKRRTKQELGFEPNRIDLYTTTVMRDDGALKFISLYYANYNGPFYPDISHIERLEFRPVPTVIEESRTYPQRFTPTFLHLLPVSLAK